MVRKQIYFFSAFCLLFSCLILPVFGDQTLKIGGRQGWKDISYTRNVTIGTGRYGYDSYMLSEQTIRPDETTDLLLTFENGTAVEETGNYTVDSTEVFIGDNSARGEKAALFRSETSGIKLTGNPDSLFGRQGLTDSFSIEFWLCPLSAGNGEVIFSWRSSRNLESYSLYQNISATVYGSRMRWDFTNIFDIMSEENSFYSLLGVTPLIPGTWSHHEITYDAETGMLEYKMNGSTEDICFVTDSGFEIGTVVKIEHENEVKIEYDNGVEIYRVPVYEIYRGTVYEAHLGVPATLNICPSYTGWLDNFCIRRNSDDNENAAFLYPEDGGRFETDLFTLGKNGAAISSINSVAIVPDQTWVEFFVRSAESPFDWTETTPEWKAFTPGETLEDVDGVWFQLAADLYPDGACSVSPSVSEFTITYNEYEIPVTPYDVRAVAGDGYVELSWSGTAGNSMSNTAGYIVYYGKRPGEDLGNDATEGSSPIYVGKKTSIKITGLENGKIYYFAVAGVSASSPQIIGQLSQEVYARPMYRKRQ